MNVIISYIILGLSLAAPIGPINAAQLEKGIKNGFLHSWLVGLGAMVADILYMAAVYFGLVQFLEIPIIKAFLWLFGFFILIYTGVESLITAGRLVSSRRKNEESAFKSFFSGFLMSLSNPLTILFWLGIYGSVLAKTVTMYETNQLLLYSSAIFIGIVIWDFTMAIISSSFRRILSANILTFISIISGLSLICFGLYFGYQGISILFF